MLICAMVLTRVRTVAYRPLQTSISFSLSSRAKVTDNVLESECNEQ
jgi:hypothetical protein